jgi:hypothetical protein|tara:strand:+ start:1202 stop:1507 length:306 start_codon:yes stop_codon:yes gene_type:complete
MKDNKKYHYAKKIIIAEFMGGKLDPNDDSVVIFKTHFGNHVFPIDELDYDESWDMLMPVVEKCLNTDENTEGMHYFINDALLTCNIEVVYDRIVEFIYDKL